MISHDTFYALQTAAASKALCDGKVEKDEGVSGHHMKSDVISNRRGHVSSDVTDGRDHMSTDGRRDHMNSDVSHVTDGRGDHMSSDVTDGRDHMSVDVIDGRGDHMSIDVTAGRGDHASNHVTDGRGDHMSSDVTDGDPMAGVEQ